MMGGFFFIFKLLGMLRISANEEYAGLDVSKHGGSAYVTYNDNGQVCGRTGQLSSPSRLPSQLKYNSSCCVP